MTLQQLAYFAATLAFSLSGQALIKVGVTRVVAGHKPSALEFASRYLLPALLSGHVIVGLLASAVGVLFWMYVLSMFELSRAIPILGGIAYVLLFIVGRFVLHEQVSWLHFAGICLIVLGLVLLSQRVHA